MIDWEALKDPGPPPRQVDPADALDTLLPEVCRQRTTRHAFGPCPLCQALNTFAVDLLTETFDCRCKSCDAAGPIEAVYEQWWEKTYRNHEEAQT